MLTSKHINNINANQKPIKNNSNVTNKLPIQNSYDTVFTNDKMTKTQNSNEVFTLVKTIKKKSLFPLHLQQNSRYMWICSHKITRVFIRNLHQTTELDTIKEKLELRLFEVRRVTNVLHKITKAPLPLFFVDLEPSGKLNKIYQLSSLFRTKIKEPYKPKTINQCNNCQDYCHTKSYYRYLPQGVSCGTDYKIF